MMNAARSMCGCTDSESGPLADRSHPSVGGASIEPFTVAATQDRSFATLTDGEVDGARGARHERDHRGLVAFADDAQRAMSSFEAEVLDVGRARFADPQAVQTEQHRQRRVVVVVRAQR